MWASTARSVRNDIRLVKRMAKGRVSIIVVEVHTCTLTRWDTDSMIDNNSNTDESGRRELV